jgi:lysyl-tRNA synthetase class 2
VADLTSSVFKTADYDPVTRVLTLAFHSGTITQYADVPTYRYQELCTAKSAGQYYHRYIRGKYQAPEEEPHG